MASPLTRLVKDTAVYGFSTIVGRLLNWMLVPFYVRVLASTGDYGVVTNLYAWTALLLVLLTYGMETGFFRFVNSESNPRQVYATCLKALGSSSLLFVVISLLFLQPLSAALGYAEYPLLVGQLVLIVASDAFMALPYAYLRYAKRPWRFAAIKLTFVAVNIGLNLFFLLLCPWLYRSGYSALINWFYRPDYGVGYIFLSNLIANAVVLAMLLPTVLQARGGQFSWALFRRIFVYSFPILLLGIAGIFNQMADKILFPLLIPSREEALSQLGIYGGCFKIAVVMVLFSQAFRYAFEPFFFEKEEGPDGEMIKRRNLATVTHYYWLVLLLMFVAIMAYLDVLKYLVVPDYYSGLKVIPYVMWGEMMMGLALNLSTWYKLTNRTIWGAIISAVGCTAAVLIMVWGVPHYGFMACAWALAISNSLIVLLSYLMGRRYYPVPYRLKSGLGYLLLGGVCYLLIYWSNGAAASLEGWRWVLNTLIVVGYALFIVYREPPLRHAFSQIGKKIYGR